MPMEDLFRLARTSTVAQILERSGFSEALLRRRADLDPGAALPAALQGYDSVAIRSHVAFSGTEQSFNVLLAREIQKAYGVETAVRADDAEVLPGIDGVQKCDEVG